MFLNYCTNILVVGFVYFLSNLSRSISSELKTFCKTNKKIFLKDFRIQRKTLVPESSFKVAECFKKETLAQVFHCRFHKIFKKCFVEHLQRFASEIAKFQATSSRFIKESVLFNCLSIKNNKTRYFLFHLPLIYFKAILPKHIFDYRPIPEKKTNRGIQDMEFEGLLVKVS